MTAQTSASMTQFRNHLSEFHKSETDEHETEIMDTLLVERSHCAVAHARCWKFQHLVLGTCSDDVFQIAVTQASFPSHILCGGISAHPHNACVFFAKQLDCCWCESLLVLLEEIPVLAG